MSNTTLELTAEEAQALKEKLEWLMREANGVDIWLAPGGTLDVNEGDAGTECFLDCDEEAHFRLGSILVKLAGYTVRRTNEGTFAFVDPDGTADDRPGHATEQGAWEAAFADSGLFTPHRTEGFKPALVVDNDEPYSYEQAGSRDAEHKIALTLSFVDGTFGNPNDGDDREFTQRGHAAVEWMMQTATLVQHELHIHPNDVHVAILPSTPPELSSAPQR